MARRIAFGFLLILCLVAGACTDDMWGRVGPVFPDLKGTPCWRNWNFEGWSYEDKLDFCSTCHYINKPSL